MESTQYDSFEILCCMLDLISLSIMEVSGMSATDVFCITDQDGRLLPPAVQATVLAKYSRSPLSARELVRDLTEAAADKFQEKWVVGYGHNSVAELAVVPVCFEGVSIVASKFIEGWQRAGYSEKSTRYQVFSRDSFITPPGAPATMKKFAERFYDAYERLLPKVTMHVAKLVGDDMDNPKASTRARAFDNVRYLLPAGTGTNVAAVVNMLDARRMVSGLKGHANPEFRALGEKMEVAVTALAPTLVRHTEPDGFQLPVKGLGNLPEDFSHDDPAPYVKLHKPHLLPSPALEQASFESSVADMHGMDWTSFSAFMETRPAFSEVPNVFKTVKLSFEVMMDYGAYRDLQRHRRCEQFAEPLGIHYGYVVPEDIAGTEFETEYRQAMEAIDAYDDEAVIHDQDLFQYMIPLGYLHRSVFQMDMKEWYYLTELRTKPQGHISYRRIAYEMFNIGSRLYPGLTKWCRAVKPDAVGVHH
jgi:thymidylate synthase ThyX